MPSNTLQPDPWSSLRRHTAARIALGRAGGSLPTAELLDFAMAHAAARDAVHAELDAQALEKALASLGLPCVQVTTATGNRTKYLQRPDLGRNLDDESRARLAGLAGGGCDVAFIVADGLSAPAAQRQAPLLLAELLPILQPHAMRIGPVCIALQARVALQDEVGELLRARAAVILIGERPGLQTADSLGAYLVFAPRPGRTDAQRNCISNIRSGGQEIPDAAATLAHLILQSLHRQISGIALKDERPARGLRG